MQKKSTTTATHILFTLSSDQGASGCLPDFFAVPFDEGGIIYTATTEQHNPQKSKEDFIKWYKEMSATKFITFCGNNNDVAEFTSTFSRFLTKDYREFMQKELAYFGFGNMGFCMGKASINGDRLNPQFVLAE